MSLLVVDKISVCYGQIAALREASFAITTGELVFITGPNGAGKSTLLKAIAGVIAPVAGEIRLDGKVISGLAPESTARLGVAMVPEGREIFSSLTIDENLRLGTGIRRDRDAINTDLSATYELFPTLSERRNRLAGILSGGQQQMLAIARALMMRPRLLTIDEPSLGLAPNVIDQVYDTLLKLRDHRGLTLLIVEQSSTRALMAGGRILLMRSGNIVLEGNSRKLARGTQLKDAYFGHGKN
jgi:branched-chain amino acid transport system ATP-binding protein